MTLYRTHDHDDGRVFIGRFTYGDPDIRVWGDGTRLTIGRYCSIAQGVVILVGGEHRADWVSTYPFPVLRGADWPEVAGIIGHPASKGDVTIGNDVWIGTEALVLSGVRVGDGAIIGARSVVSRDVEPYAVVAGNPARTVRMRFDPDVIARLLAVRWWDWDEEVVRAHAGMLCSGDVGGFLRAAESLLTDPGRANQEGAQT